jgi:uncharacterized protein YacL
MNISLAFTRVFFMILSTVFMTVFMVAVPEGSKPLNAFFGVCLGIAFSLLLYAFDIFFRRFNLRSFNVAVLGLFFGYLMGQALVLSLGAILSISSLSSAISPSVLEMVRVSFFLFGLYLGTLMTIRSSDEIHVSIPFVKLAPLTHKKKDLLIDISALADARIIDVAATGLFDSQLIIPRFVVKELYAQAENSDEMNKAKARRALEVIKKLEAIPTLDLRFYDTDFPEMREVTAKLIRLARLLDSNIITADISRIQMSALEGVRVINMHTLSNALKPLMQTGEVIKIKIQRYGKEPRQGVGYLEDGTMVVVNGGGDFIGDVIDSQVLSVKHTSSGRMIFCNAFEEQLVGSGHHNHRDYDDEDER